MICGVWDSAAAGLLAVAGAVAAGEGLAKGGLTGASLSFPNVTNGLPGETGVAVGSAAESSGACATGSGTGNSTSVFIVRGPVMSSSEAAAGPAGCRGLAGFGTAGGRNDGRGPPSSRP